MPNALFCWHSYGKWGKLRNGFRTRTCKKCGKKQKKNAGFFDQLFCWHHYGGNRGKRSLVKCRKCGKINQKAWSTKLSRKRPGHYQDRHHLSVAS